MRRGDGIPWIDPAVRRRIRNFERVVNAYYPTVTDLRLTPVAPRGAEGRERVALRAEGVRRAVRAACAAAPAALSAAGDDGVLMTMLIGAARRVRRSGPRPIRAHAHNPLMRVEQSVVETILGQLRAVRALDVGTGSGRYLPLLARLARAWSSASTSRSRCWRAAAGCARVCGDACRLPVRRSAFDLINASLMVGDVADLDAWMREMARALAVGGHLVYSDFHPSWAQHGWSRTFRAAVGELHDVAFHPHTIDDHLAALDARACASARSASRASGSTPTRAVAASAGAGAIRRWSSCFTRSKSRDLGRRRSRSSTRASSRRRRRRDLDPLLVARARARRSRRGAATWSSILTARSCCRGCQRARSSRAEPLRPAEGARSLRQRHGVDRRSAAAAVSGDPAIRAGTRAPAGRAPLRRRAEEPAVGRDDRRAPQPVLPRAAADDADPRRAPVRVGALVPPRSGSRPARAASPAATSPRARATPADAPFIVHLAEGVDDGAARRAAAARSARRACEPNTVIVHGVAQSSPVAGARGAAGAGLVWCPSSNRVSLRPDRARPRAARRSIGACSASRRAGTDSRVTGSRDLLDELRAARDGGRVSPPSSSGDGDDRAAALLRQPRAGRLAVGARRT